MAAKQHRYKGRFERKSKTEWRKNVSLAVKRRKKDSDDTDKFCTVEGMRIMNVSNLATDMWCHECGRAMSFRFIQEKSVSGLASTFKIKCDQCLRIYLIHTSNVSNINDNDHRKRQFSVNLKAAAAMIDASIGGCQLNTILSGLNVPTVQDSLLRRHERVVEKALKELADKSCERAIHEEVALTIEKNMSSSNEVTSVSPVELTSSTDGQWPKRGNGYSYDSNSGIF